MELIYIEPGGVWKGLASHLTADLSLGNSMLDPRKYGGIRKDSDHHGSYYVMKEEAYRKAQRDCFKFFYRNASRKLSLGDNEIIRDRTIACNLMLMKYDMQSLETGRMVLRDASPYMAKLMYGEIRQITPEEYEENIIEYAQNFAKQVERLRNDGNFFIMETPVKAVEAILMGVVPFALPKIISIRKYDKYIATQLLMMGRQFEDIYEKVSEYSLLPVCLASDAGFEGYVRKIVAEAIFEYKYPERIESQWAKEVNEHIKMSWLFNPDEEGAIPIPCRIVGKKGDKIKVLASDADAELELPYNRDGIYEVDSSWLMILSKEDTDEKWFSEAGLISCTLI